MSMKYLDTYETWSKIFKLIGENGDYTMFVHNNGHSNEMSIIHFNKKELVGLANFILCFCEDSNDIS